MNIFSDLIDAVYPPRCHICHDFLQCGQPENGSGFFCQACSDDFNPITSPICPVCSAPLDASQEDHWCEDCLRKRPHYEATHACYLYDGAVMDVIHQFKYGAKSYLSESLGPLFAQFTGNLFLKSDKLLTMPVPLHPKRLRERGFNQSLLLARHVAVQLGTDLDFLSLRRIKYTSPQTGLGKEERRKNVRNAFQLTHSEAVKGKTVLLVDDVATTGNTLNECARILKKSGSRDVFCLVLARAGF